jgi:hypothetical protein
MILWLDALYQGSLLYLSEIEPSEKGFLTLYVRNLRLFIEIKRFIFIFKRPFSSKFDYPSTSSGQALDKLGASPRQAQGDAASLDRLGKLSTRTKKYPFRMTSR